MKYSLCFFLILSFSNLLSAQEKKNNLQISSSNEIKIEKIDKLLNACAEYRQFNGSVLIAQNGKVIYKNGLGMANMEWNIPNEVDTKHRLASISKQFTSMLILQLAAENKLQLNIPITSYLGDYPKSSGDKITIHHLLSHTSGIPNYTSFPTYWEMMRKPHSPADITKLFADLDLEFTPGEKFNYSNSGYVLLGIIIENITGTTYEQALQDQIFTPLGMHDSGLENQKDVIPNKASGYNKFANIYEKANYINMSAAYAAGAIYSTVEDLFLWDQALYTYKLLPPKYMDVLFQAHASAWGGQSYGYGWEVGKTNIGRTKERVESLSHGGVVNGFNTQITRIPSSKSSIILLNNTGGAPLFDMVSSILGILYDKPYVFPKRSAAFSFLDVLEKDGIKKALAYYEEIKSSKDFLLDEQEMNIAGYKLFQSGDIKNATAVFKLNVKSFPESFNTYDSYGEALMAMGQKDLAVENYKKSVKLNPVNQNGIDILKGLGIDTESLMSKVPIEHLQLLAGTYEAINQNREWQIVIEESNGTLFGNDGDYRYQLNAVGNDRFINPDDGATLIFDASNKDNLSFIIFGRVTFKKIDE